MSKLSLPIDPFLPQLEELLKTHQNCVVTASPGAGKTTRVPVALADSLPGKILVLEPRRMAAVAAATRVAEETDSKVGERVGYQVRYLNKTSQQTQIIFLTEALLTKKIQEDPELRNVSAIILDEFHERSVHTDLSLGLIRELQMLGSEIRLIVMSATLNAEVLANYLGKAPILNVPGKTYPLKIIYSQKPQILNLKDSFFKALENTLFEALSQCTQDILIFLPGQGEIENAYQRLQFWCDSKNLELQKLHGNLPIEEQKKILSKSAKRRVILSTNIAESSVTLDGVDGVIDCGLEKVLRSQASSPFSRLELTRISLASATQRAGRAARQKDGICFKMWSKLDEASMSPFLSPEILRIDLSETLLVLSQQGITNFNEFSWFEPPPQRSLELAEEKLKIIGALSNSGEITELGQQLLKLPLPIELGRLVLSGHTSEEKNIAIQIACILQEKDILSKEHGEDFKSHDESDLLIRLEILNTYLERKSVRFGSRSALEIVAQSYQQLCQLFNLKPRVFSDLQEKQIYKLLLNAFRLRLGRRRKTDPQKGVLTSGKGIQFASHSSCQKAEYFFALSGVDIPGQSDALISIAHPIEKSEILSFYKDSIRADHEITYNHDKGEIYRKTVKKLDHIILEEGPAHLANPEEIAEALPQVLISRWNEFANKNEDLRELAEKISFLKSHKTLFDLGLQTQLESFQFEDEDFKKDFCTMAAQGQTQFQKVCHSDLSFLISTLLPPEIFNLIKKLPKAIEVPSGSRIKVHYSVGKNPYIEVRIQELFGWTETPQILDTFPLVIHLLGPNFKPMQVTSDLKSFWNQTYADVRKELRLKYPKHQWPEDPRQGVAEAKGTRKFKNK